MSAQQTSSEINFEHLKRYVGDDIALTAEVFGLFKHQVEMWSKLLDAEADEDSWVSVMHSLKGSARAIGAMGLASLCEKGEAMTKDGTGVAIRAAHVQNVQFSIERALIDIGRWEYRQTLASLRS